MNNQSRDEALKAFIGLVMEHEFAGDRELIAKALKEGCYAGNYQFDFDQS